MPSRPIRSMAGWCSPMPQRAPRASPARPSSACRCAMRSPAPRRWWARTASTTSSRAISMASRPGMPPPVQIVAAVLLVVPLAPLLARLVFQPIADASVLVLLIVSLALHFLLSGLGLLFFGPEGSRTHPLASGTFTLGDGFSVSGQVILMVASALVLSGLFFLGFERTVAGKALRATAANLVA